ncbi:MAG: bacillithiol biosynthesis cysteine-adding enzyme BshC [Bacteroidota bacterium]
MKTATKSIRKDYLSGAKDLQPFFQYAPSDQDFSAAIARKAREDIDRKLLKAAIEEQYAGLEITEQTAHHIAQLDKETCFTVTTGHQLVLFGGPMFTTYKILSAIKLAAQLQARYPDHQFVPIFWIHTEDHDFEEINHFYPSFQEKRTYFGQFKGAVGDHILTDEISGLAPAHLPEALKAAYTSGKRMADAFRAYFNELFGHLGLVMLDADHPGLKARFSRVLREEVESQASYHAVNATSSALMAAGYPLQISPREINLFLLDEQGRDRLDKQGNGFHRMGTEARFSAREMLNLIDKNPERFSPNVSLRPLYQEMILPNLAYFGGWGELSYWLQLKGVFDHFKVQFPRVLPRMSATLFTREQLTAWEALGFIQEDIQQSQHQLYEGYMPQIWKDDPLFEIQRNLYTHLDQLGAFLADEVDPLMKRSAEALKVKNQHFLKNLNKKVHRVIRHKHPKAFDEIARLKQAIQPDRTVQERMLSLASFPAHAPRQIIDLAWKHCEPLQFQHQYLILE